MTPPRKTKAEEPTDDVEDDDASGKDDGTASGDSGSGTVLDGIEERIRELVREAVDALTGDSGKGSGHHTLADDEERIRRLVKDSQKAIQEEEKKEGRFSTLEEKVEKIFEKPPQRDGFGGKVSRWLWGDSE